LKKGNDHRKSKLILTAAGILLLVWLFFGFVSCSLLNFSPLKVIAWSPGKELVTSLDEVVVSVSFSSQMDTLKAESSFSLLENGRRIDGKYLWPDKKTLRFVPLHSLIENAKYEIQVSTDCEDLNGNSLQKQFYKRFSTSSDETRPEVVSVSPVDGSKVSDRLTLVVINFSEPVDASSFYSSFSVSPEIEGDFEWSGNGDTVTFNPAEYYQYHTEYTVTVTEELKDLSFNSLKEDYNFKFSVGTDTEKPYVASAGESGGSLTLTPDNPEDGMITVNYGWEANWDFKLTFSEDVDTETVSSAITFSPAINFSMDSSGTRYAALVTLTPETGFEYGKTYKLSIDEGIKDREENTLTPVTYYFKVDGSNTKPPEITRTVFLEDPGSGTLSELNYGDVISLSNYPDSPGSTEGFFDIYISVANLPSVDRDELKLMVMNNFDITSTNSSADFVTKGVVIDPEAAGETPVPNPSPAAGEIVARIFMDITNNSGNAGIVELSLSDGFEDGNGNVIAEKWVTRFQKN